MRYVLACTKGANMGGSSHALLPPALYVLDTIIRATLDRN